MQTRSRQTVIALTLAAGIATSGVLYTRTRKPKPEPPPIVQPAPTTPIEGIDVTPDTLRSYLSAGAVPPGTTLLLTTGTYTGQFDSRVAGTAEAPILIREKSGEKAVFTGNVDIYGTYSQWWGMTFRNNAPPAATYPGDGVEIRAANVKLINVVADQCGQGIGAWAFPDCEVYGCIITRNGWINPTTGVKQGHGIYIQNGTGGKLIEHNIVGPDNIRYGVHAYGEQGKLDNLTFKENIAYGNLQTQWLVGGSSSPMHNLTLIGNIVSAYGKTALLIGYTAKNHVGLQFENNLILGKAQFTNWIDQITATGNTVINSADVLTWNPTSLTNVPLYPPANWDGNAYFTPKVNPFLTDGKQWYSLAQWRVATGYDMNSTLQPLPAPTTLVKIYPNRYEPGRAHIVVYRRGGGAAEASVNLDSVLTNGQEYQIYRLPDLENPVATGQHTTGVGILLPLNNVEFVTFLVRSN